MTKYLLIALGVATMVFFLTAISYVLALHRHNQVVVQVEKQLKEIDRVVALRDQHPAVVAGIRADTDLLARIQHSLGQIGLPASACTGVMPRGDEMHSEGILRRRSEAITLTGFSIADLGRWLAEFRQADNPWRVIELQCTAGGGEGSLDRNHYSINLLVATEIVESSP
jgi:hypothetical protein